MNEPNYNGVPFCRYKEFFEAYKALSPEEQKEGTCSFVFDLSFIIKLLDSLDDLQDEVTRLKARDTRIIDLQRQLIAAEDEIRRLKREI